MCLFLALNMDCLKRYAVFFCCLLHNRNILCIERTLAGVIQNVSCFINMRVFSAVLELRIISVSRERQVPQLNTIISLVTYGKALVFQKLRIGKERLFLS